MLSKKINYIPIFDVTILQMKQADDVVQSSEESKLSTCVPQKYILSGHKYWLSLRHMEKIFHWIQVKKEKLYSFRLSVCIH